MSKSRQRAEDRARLAVPTPTSALLDLKHAHTEIAQLRRANATLTRQLGELRHSRGIARDLLDAQTARADLFERRYIGVCSLLRMVIDQFDEADRNELLRG
jgi:hypothetical protein